MSYRLPSDAEIEHLLADLRGLGRTGERAAALVQVLQDRLDDLIPANLSDREVAGRLAKLSGDYLDAALGLGSSPRE